MDYNLTKDGRYLIRAYRKNEYEGIIQGYVVETGLRFIMSVEYNKFKEIFQQRKLRREMKKENKSNEVEIKQSTTGQDVPLNDTPAVVQFEKVPADNRKSTHDTANVKTTED